MEPAYYFTYANPQGDLPFLEQEEKAIDHIFAQRIKSGEGTLQFWKNTKVNPNDIDSKFDTFWDRLMLYHFSGHAGRDRLVLSGANAFSKGIALQMKFLLEKKREQKGLGRSVEDLALVFLNGCSTFEQVEALHRAGVPVVIGTSGSISDELAALFSEKFYYAFVLLDCTIEKAFEYAEGIILSQSNKLKIHRAIHGLEPEREDEETPFWGISCKEDEEYWLSRKLSVYQNQRPADSEVNKILVTKLCNALTSVSQVASVRERYNKGERTKELKNDLVSALHSAYPAVIGNELRRLLSTSQNKELLRLGETRLRQLVKTFQTAAELLFFISLSQLFTALLKQTMQDGPTMDYPPKDPKKLRLLKTYFDTTKKERRFFDFIPLIRAARLLFDDYLKQQAVALNGECTCPGISQCLKEQAAFPNGKGSSTNKRKLSYFMTEQEDLAKEAEKPETELYNATRFMRGLCSVFEKDLLNVKDEASLVYLCRETEKQLAAALGSIAFSARYDLVSIKNVELYLPRHKIQPLYILKIPVAEEIDDWFDSGNRPTPPRLSNPVHPRAVLLAKDDALLTDGKVRELTDDNQLNLYPFLIDLSVIASNQENLSTVDLYVFSHFEKAGDDYRYYYVQSINFENEVVIDKSHLAYADIHEPFQDMIQRLFHPNLDQS